MKVILLTSFALLVGLTSTAQAIQHRPLSVEEKRKYTPTGVGIQDNTTFSHVVESYLQDNIQVLAPYGAINKSESTLSEPELLGVWNNANLEVQQLLHRLRGTLGMGLTDIYAGLRDRQTDESYVHALLRNREAKLARQYCGGIPLRTGRAIRFNYKAGLNIPIRYVLKRTSATAYQALLNLNVVDKAHPANGRATLNKIKSCMALTNPYLKGPNGKTLEIKVYGPHEVGALPKFYRPEQLEIKVAPESEGRGHAFLYRNSWECDTILHEVLHLVGLVDEYQENGDFVSESTCRVVPTNNTIMGTISTFFPRVVKSTVKCECKTEACKQLAGPMLQSDIDRLRRHAAPCGAIGAKPVGNRYTNVSPNGKSGLHGDYYYFVPDTDLTSLLTDVQFERIISGYCPTTVPNYAKCSIYSQLGANDARCLGRPAECVNEANFSGNPF